MVWRPLGCSPIGDADHRTLPTSMIRSDVQRADRDPAAAYVNTGPSRRQRRMAASSQALSVAVRLTMSAFGKPP